MSREALALELTAQIYDANLEPEGWRLLLERLADALGAGSGHLLFHRTTSPDGAILLTCGTDPEGARAYGEYYGALDPWAKVGRWQQAFVPGRVHLGSDLVPHRKLVKTEYFNDFARRFGVVQLLAVTLLASDGVWSSVSFNRPEAAPSFGEEERELLHLLVPHLQRALAIESRLTGLRSAQKAAEETIERLPFAVLVLRPDGHVLFCNGLARAIIGMNDGLRLTGKGLSAAMADESRALAALIRSAAEPRQVVVGSAGGVMRVSRPSARESIIVNVMRLDPHELLRPDPGGCAVAVILHDPEQRLTVAPDSLRAMFGLTPTEASLASDVASGLSLGESAKRRGVRESTVRWHMKRVLAKTGARTQADLVRRILQGPAGFCGRD